MIVLNINGCSIPFEKTIFSDGAVSVKLTSAIPKNPEKAFISVYSEGSLNEEFFVVASLENILRRLNNRIHITLRMPYIPYARQDRSMVRNDAFSLKVFSQLLNSLCIDEVQTLDAHSDVSPALIDRCLNITQDKIFKISSLNEEIKGWADVIVCPDAGAAKKTHKNAEVLGFDPNSTVFMEKVRDVSNGHITSTRITSNHDNLRGAHAIIIDDLCDGGGTFIQSAAALYDAGVAGVGLFVTHGIFSRGIQPILEAGINRIWTTDSFKNTKQGCRVSDFPEVKVTCFHNIFNNLGY